MEPVPYGFCHCRCGQKTKPCSKTMTARGWVKGEPLRFINRHFITINDGRDPQKRRYDKLRRLGICVQCGQKPAGNTVFCDECKVRDREARKVRPSTYRAPVHQCLECGASLGVTNRQYCDEHSFKTCAECGIRFKFRRKSKRAVCCSDKCAAKWATRFRGSAARNWRGGKVAESQCIRGRIEYKEWRQAVFARDNWTCQDCGKRGSRTIHAHHIKEFAKYPDLRFEVSNGVTLCKPCHENRHKRRIGNGNGPSVIKSNTGNRVRSRNNDRRSFILE